MTMAFLVLAEGAVRTEKECQRILTAAEVAACEIVATAHDDAARLKDWLAASGTQPSGGRPARVDRSVPRIGMAEAARPQPPEPSPPPEASEDADDDAATAFFDSFPADTTDRWDFLDAEGPVGFGPALMRRLLGRPGGPRP